MNYLSIDYLIVYAFLGITALVGLGGLRMSAASKSFREYAIANQSFGLGALIITFLATHMSGGWLFALPDRVYDHGLTWILQQVLMVAVPVFYAVYFIAPRIVHFKNCLTTGDLMNIFYGEYARIITGLLAFVFCTGVCAYQLFQLNSIGHRLGFSNSWELTLGVVILALYTAHGGMRAVTLTDIFHFAVAIGILPLIVHLIINQAGGFRAILSALSPKQSAFFHLDGLPYANTISSYMAVVLFPTYTISFPYIQRLLMAKHQGQSRGMYLSGGIVLVSFICLMSLVGLAGIVLYPTGPSPQFLLIHITEQLPIASKVLYVAAAGIIISTADSLLHAASVSFTHDTLRPLADKWGIKLDELRAVRKVMILVSLASLALVLISDKVPAIYSHAVRLSGVLFVTPLFAGIMGLKTDKRVYNISTALVFLTYLLPMIMLGNSARDMAYNSSVMVSILSYLGAHYYYHRGFEIVNRSAYGQTTSVWHPSWQGARTVLTSFVPTPQKVVRYFQQRVAENSSNTTTLALFIAVSYMAPLFMHSVGQPEAYNWLLVLRIGGALFCVGLLLQSQWPDTLLPYFPTYYHLTLLYCFPFMTTFLFFLEGGTIVWMMNVMLSVMLFIMLLDYMTAVGLSIVGVALAMGIYKLGIGPLDLSVDSNTAYMMAYGVGFSIIIGVLFSRLRERLLRQANRRLVHQEAAFEAHFPAVMAENERRARAFQQIGIKSLLHTARKLHTIQHKAVAAQEEQQALLLSLSERQKALKQQQDPKKELYALAQHHLAPQAELSSLAQQQQDLQADLLPLVMQLQDLDTRGKDHLPLQVKKDLPLDQFLLSLQNKLLPRGVDVPLLIERKTKQQKIAVDADKLAALLVKGIAALQWLLQDQDQYLLLGLEDTQLAYPLPDVAEGYVKQIPALRMTLTATEELPPLASSYRPDLSNFTPEAHQTFQTMEQQADTRLIKAHYGYIEVSEDTLIYVIPVDVYEVRPLDMDKPELAIGVLPERANDHFKHETADAHAQEETFLKEVATKSKADLGLVKLALNLIKWYHGHKNRHSGEPFYLHPMAVAQIAMDYNQDEATIVGALLHDTVEDTPMLLAHIEALFGKETAEVVNLVTHLQSIPGSMYKIKLSAEENLRMLSNSENKRGLYVKLADRMHNMRTINGHDKVSKRKLVAQEAIDFFVPLAKKLGLAEAAQELRDRCEAVLEISG